LRCWSIGERCIPDLRLQTNAVRLVLFLEQQGCLLIAPYSPSQTSIELATPFDRLGIPHGLFLISHRLHEDVHLLLIHAIHSVRHVGDSPCIRLRRQAWAGLFVVSSDATGDGSSHSVVLFGSGVSSIRTSVRYMS
jgi:hypothetical protein